MSCGNQGTTGQDRQACPPLAYSHHQIAQNYPLIFPLEDLAGTPNHDARSDHSVLDEGPGVDDQMLKDGQTPPAATRPSQNRAALGKWKSKTIAGFPAANVPLPRGITAKEIAQSYPNHVDDYCILELMRQGKGAKAIDALIPAPPGKTKAGQSHSKIQLRISTIREAFPNENFPITSTKRDRTRSRSEIPKDETIDSNNEHTIFVTANHKSNSDHTTAGALASVSFHTAETQHQNRAAVQRHGGHGSSTQSGAFGSLHQQVELPLLSESNDHAASFTPELLDPALRFPRTLPLDSQVKEEYQIHQQLVHDHFYCDRPLSPLEVRQTVQAHCAWIYDRISYNLQTKSGLKMEKVILRSGWSEHSISYLHRTITECFRGHPVFRAHMDRESLPNQVTNRFETAVLQDLLGRLRDWTRYLKAQKETKRQTRAHQKLHSKASTNRNTAPNQMRLQYMSPRIYASSGLRPDQLKAFGPEDQMMTDAPRLNPGAARKEFEDYMEDAERFINHEARAADLTPVSDNLDEGAAIDIAKEEIAANIMAKMDNDAFILFGWQLLTSHKFGAEAEAKLEEQRDRLYEIGEDEVQRAMSRGLQGDANEDVLELGDY
ncbi:hypothetical protein EPUS_07067 [Endocarpon pusillum Z07020]|uniref:Uncharacterized protein n=1 Tax=Endocarpon pusillum (strain Z07020 / HMAS-L-300199) TaxID=1263415 RepID=U1HZL3_ENDPU|nr:uncharacterized protein EPUS_07067 [Endocarpon pusillum Z07020]ERF76360.1 hypothetical protein EPUS_07067 [Endocarpon pusillum Z07020]